MRTHLKAVQAVAMVAALGAAPMAALAQGVRPARAERGPDATGAYDWIDRADVLWDAIGDAPPDYAFAFEGREPWAWEAADGWRIVVEDSGQDIRSYYFEPGARGPFLAVEPGVSFGYAGSMVAVVYGADGTPLPPGARGRYLASGNALYERGRRLLRAMEARNRVAVDTLAWVEAVPWIFSFRQEWDEGLYRNPVWRQHRDRDAAREWRRRLDRERALRLIAADRFRRWREGGFQGPPPGHYGRPDRPRPGAGRPHQPGMGRPDRPGRPGWPGAGRPPQPGAGVPGRPGWPPRPGMGAPGRPMPGRPAPGRPFPGRPGMPPTKPGLEQPDGVVAPDLPTVVEPAPGRPGRPGRPGWPDRPDRPRPGPPPVQTAPDAGPAPLPRPDRGDGFRGWRDRARAEGGPPVPVTAPAPAPGAPVATPPPPRPEGGWMRGRRFQPEGGAPMPRPERPRPTFQPAPAQAAPPPPRPAPAAQPAPPPPPRAQPPVNSGVKGRDTRPGRVDDK